MTNRSSAPAAVPDGGGRLDRELEQANRPQGDAAGAASSAVEMRWTPSATFEDGRVAAARQQSACAGQSLPQAVTPAEVAANVDRYGENSAKFWSSGRGEGR